MKTLFRAVVISFLLLTIAGYAASRREPTDNRDVQQNIKEFQRVLISKGVTGGSVAGVFRGEETLAYSIVNSRLPGDTPISPDTIFPIWSVSKPIRTVA